MSIIACYYPSTPEMDNLQSLYIESIKFITSLDLSQLGTLFKNNIVDRLDLKCRSGMSGGTGNSQCLLVIDSRSTLMKPEKLAYALAAASLGSLLLLSNVHAAPVTNAGHAAVKPGYATDMADWLSGSWHRRRHAIRMEPTQCPTG